MTNRLLHRGPDDIGFFQDKLIDLGHTRLSIMDLSDASAQPFIDPGGRYVLVFNGELYNYKSLRSQLHSYSFVTEGDTEVLLAAFMQWGMNCLHKLDGIFAFAVWDCLEQTLWMARDRLGVKPFYYANPDGLFIFSSEQRAILASGILSHRLNRNSLAGFLQFQSAGYPGMLVDGIMELPPGHFARFKGGVFDVSTYWKISPIELDTEKPIKKKELNKTLFQLLNHAVKARMLSAAPTGVFLSGGVDSSAIAAIMSLHQSEPVNTFTLHLDDADLNEAESAGQFAKRYRSQHHNIIVHPVDCQQQVSDFLSDLDSPSMDGLNTYLISAAAANAGMKVMLSGLGGDELFAGYPGFRYAKKLQQYKFIYDRSGFFRKKLASAIAGLNFFGSFPIFRLLSANSHKIADCYPAFRQIMGIKEVRKFIRSAGNPEEEIRHRINGLTQLNETFHLANYSRAEYSNYALNTLLRDNDQAGMAHSIEIREPFFDYRLIEFVCSLPDTFKLSDYPKQMLVDALHPFLPGEINVRKKKGFVLPMEKWMRNELYDLCKNYIYSLGEREFIHKPHLLEAWKRFSTARSGERWTTIWMLVVLGAWMDKNDIT